MKPESSATLGAPPTLLPRKSNINSSRPFIQMNLASGQPAASAGQDEAA